MQQNKLAIGVWSLALLLAAAACDSDNDGESGDGDASTDAMTAPQMATEGSMDATAPDASLPDATQPDATPPDAEVDAGPVIGLNQRPSGQSCVLSDPDAGSPLSSSGCFTGSPAAPAATLIPFEVAAPLWSDGALKERYMAIPDGEHIEVDADGDFIFPVGTVMVKNFRLGTKKVETRLLMQASKGVWKGYSYKWNDGGNEAFLLPAGGDTITVGTQDWKFPSRGDCNTCHTKEANHVLGPELAQLNFEITYPATGRKANQLDTLSALDLIEPKVWSIEAPKFPHYDDTQASATKRARAYLHSNCSGCHRGESFAGRRVSFKAQLPLAETGACRAPQGGSAGLDPATARIVAPGSPEHSVLVARVKANGADGGTAKMPPLAVSMLDDAGVQLIEGWIKEVQAEDCYQADASVSDASAPDAGASRWQGDGGTWPSNWGGRGW